MAAATEPFANRIFRSTELLLQEPNSLTSAVLRPRLLTDIALFVALFVMWPVTLLVMRLVTLFVMRFALFHVVTALIPLLAFHRLRAAALILSALFVLSIGLLIAFAKQLISGKIQPRLPVPAHLQ